MFPDELYAPPTGSFMHPVPVPSGDPDAGELIAISISCEWLPYIRGALQPLALQATWDTDDPAVRTLAQMRAMKLASMFVDCGTPTPGTPFACSGDLSANSAPYGTWTPGCIGTYLSGTGWAGDFGACSGHHYNGIVLDIVLAHPIVLTNLHLTYDFVTGYTYSSGDVSGLNCHDITNSFQLGTNYHLGSVPAGTGIGFNGAGSTSETSHIQIVMCSDGDPPGGIPTGSVTLRHVDISGKAGSSGILPC